MKKYPLTITKHARERYVVRISDPNRYRHLTQCRVGCSECIRLDTELFNVLKAYRSNIDRTLSGRVLSLIKNNQKVTDTDFIRTMEKAYQIEFSNGEAREYYQDDKAVYVITREPDGHPVLITVLSEDMIDGSVLKYNTSNSKEILNRWKFQTRQNSGKIRSLNQ